MKKSQVALALRQAESGVSVEKVCRKLEGQPADV